MENSADTHPFFGERAIGVLGKYNYSLRLVLIVVLLPSVGCHASAHHDENYGNASMISALSDVAELDRIQWSIGGLKAETVFIHNDGSPTYRTTVVNASDKDMWWPGLRTGTARMTYQSVDEFEDENGLSWGGGGGTTSIGCYAGSPNAFNSEKNIEYFMKPGAVRVFEQSMDKPNEGFALTSWSFRGETDYPSLDPLVDYPAFKVPLSFNWDEEDGCSVVLPENE